jgi:hypothetical protein
MELIATHTRPLMPIVALLVYTLMLAACSKPAFEFRGYASDASCDAIVAAETSQGAELVGNVTVSELRGEVFSAPMFIEVVCHGENRPYGIWYLAVVDNLDEQAATFERLSGVLANEFRQPDVEGDAGARVARFHCDRHGLVSLFEGGDEHLAGGGEVSIFVDLRPDVC